MLTESEKRWLQLRKLYAGVNHYSYYSCMHCSKYNVGRWPGYFYPCNYACLSIGCPNIDIRSSGAVYDYVEAAEFEERVTATLAKVIATLVKENPFSDVEIQAITPDLVLKWARLSTEEEMDADRI